MKLISRGQTAGTERAQPMWREPNRARGLLFHMQFNQSGCARWWHEAQKYRCNDKKENLDQR